MAWALRIGTTIFIRRAPGPAARLTSPTHLGPCRVPSKPTSWSWTATAADRLLGMAPLGSRRTTTSTACNAHPPRATYADAGGRQTLVNAAVGVVVLSCDGEPPPHDVYGSVTAATTTVSSGGEPPLTLSHRLFDRAKGDHVRLAEEPAAMPMLLTELVVSAPPLRSELIVSASLRGVNNAYYYGDHEIAEGSVVFVSSLDGNDTAVIAGKHGERRRPLVLFIDDDGCSCAYPKFHKRSRLFIKQFNRAKGDRVRVPEEGLLLTERVVVSASAPLLRSELKVSASLRGVNNAYYYGDHQIAEGSVVFATRLDGNDSAVIAGNHGEVRVDVTWSSSTYEKS